MKPIRDNQINCAHELSVGKVLFYEADDNRAQQKRTASHRDVGKESWGNEGRGFYKRIQPLISIEMPLYHFTVSQCCKLYLFLCANVSFMRENYEKEFSYSFVFNKWLSINDTLHPSIVFRHTELHRSHRFFYLFFTLVFFSRYCCKLFNLSN